MNFDPTTDHGIQQQILEFKIFASNNRCWDPTTDPGIQQQILEFQILHPTTDNGIEQQIFELKFLLEILAYYVKPLLYIFVLKQQILSSNNRWLNLF